jgi:small conductance mechanosensitive channel
VDIGIAYRSSIDEARRVMLGLCREDSRIASAPAPEVVVTECAESSVNLKLRFWVEDESIEKKIRYEYLEKTKKAFDAAGIEIPFPHMQLFVEDSEGLRTLGKAA